MTHLGAARSIASIQGARPRLNNSLVITDRSPFPLLREPIADLPDLLATWKSGAHIYESSVRPDQLNPAWRIVCDDDLSTRSTGAN